MKLDLKEITKRLLAHYELSDNKELCKKLNWKYDTYNTWINRRSVPYAHLVNIVQNESLSMDWLLFGQEQVKLDISNEKKNINNGNIVMNGNGNFISGDIKVNESDFDTKNKVKEVFGLMKYAPPGFIDNIKNKLLEFKKFSEL